MLFCKKKRLENVTKNSIIPVENNQKLERILQNKSPIRTIVLSMTKIKTKGLENELEYKF